jgi:hypothetical protein
VGSGAPFSQWLYTFYRIDRAFAHQVTSDTPPEHRSESADEAVDVLAGTATCLFEFLLNCHKAFTAEFVNRQSRVKFENCGGDGSGVSIIPAVKVFLCPFEVSGEDIIDDDFLAGTNCGSAGTGSPFGKESPVVFFGLPRRSMAVQIHR